MLGTKTAMVALLCLYLSGLATFTTVALSDLQSTSQRDLAELNQELQRLLDSKQDPVGTVQALSQKFPLQYALVENRSDSSQFSYGKYALPEHPLALLTQAKDTPLVVDTRWQLTDIHLQLEPDYYLEHATAPLIKPITLFSGIFLAAFVLVFGRGLSIRKHIVTLQRGIQRLGSLEISPQAKQLSGPLKPLAKDLVKTKDELKEKISQLNKVQQLPDDVATIDPVTNLKSRAVFERDIATQTNKDAAHGYLVLIRAGALGEINLRLGKHDGDCYLIAIANLLRRYDNKFGQAYKYRTTDFLLLLPEMPRKEVEVILNEITYHLQDISRNHDVASAGSIGATSFARHSDPRSLLASIDTAASVAETEGPNSFMVLEHALLDESSDSLKWQNIVDDVIDNRRIAFIQQPIKPYGDELHLYTELLVRFIDEDGTPIPTESLFAMASRQGRATDIDKLIVTRLFRHLSLNADSRETYGINLASHSFTDAPFIDWLAMQLEASPLLAGRLVFEISERSIQINPDRAAKCVERLHKLGARICLDRFGSALTSFRFFQVLKPDFIKLEPGLTKGIDTNANNKFFIRMLSDIAVRMDVKVIASHVEVVEEKSALQALRIDGLQGMYIAPPAPLHLQ